MQQSKKGAEMITIRTTKGTEMKKNQMPSLGIETAESARKIVKYLGGDSSIIKDNWCYPQLKRAFPELKEAYFELIENATTGDVAMAAYWAGRHLGMPKERVFTAIENATTGDVARAAHYAGRNLGMPKGRVFTVIEKATTGEVAWAAYFTGLDLGMPKERVFAVIKNGGLK
jgi:hypothetical protein